jgi:hypothetical protein
VDLSFERIPMPKLLPICLENKIPEHEQPPFQKHIDQKASK